MLGFTPSPFMLAVGAILGGIVFVCWLSERGYDHSERSKGVVLSLWIVVALIVGVVVVWLVLGPTVFAKTIGSIVPSTKAPSGPSLSDNLVRPPTISAEQIDRVLAAAGSPAIGVGETMYREGVKRGIDPAYALGFFHKESGYGKAGVATQTHSIGNIKCTPGYTCFGEFRSYPTWADGVIDWYKLIEKEYIAKGARTLSAILPVYCPVSDGCDPQQYAQDVLSDIALWQKGDVR
ncbi:flagellum-specific peptidoglycan hydrolase FlgJ [Thermosporothrix hazakensis]|jgi:hypothetical protein|uniref:Flagellum-specific peptidoglycan hydrolase FlgJ n=1 Tax=Thermosporothrix hazakensis TaxID=644383 RepID=A0A326UD74_THEHA|nr:glucosaminidase domain-containing protein [Thermosporothrix hazakensis]PZW23893.1 flagellum-specific peptidoglycan hydrolase FlgJ [Thermosporothrix hazakensis]GCE48505.1 hypothetical protein KTH_33740 [Thermosporothrix hazakensis]